MSRKCRLHKGRPAFESLESRDLMTVFMVTDTNATGPGSLDAAIIASNKQRGTDTIDFHIPGTGDHLIGVPPTGLPAITSSVVIDGYTQPGSAVNTSSTPGVNNAILNVTLEAAPGKALLTVKGSEASGTVIQGLRFSNLRNTPYTGVELTDASRVTINGCNFSGAGQTRLLEAVLIDGGNRDTVGGTIDGDPALQNVMSNYDSGVVVQNSTNDAIVYNLIGGDTTESRFPTQRVGILISKTAKNNTVVNNYLYKNVVAIQDLGSGNVVSGNTIVPRS